jgi:hypothetical protein
MVKIINLLDFDLEATRGLKSTGSLVHRFGFDPAAKFQRIGVGNRKQFGTEGGPPTGLSFKVSPPGVCTILSQDMSIKFGSRQGMATIEAAAAGVCKLVLANSAGKAVDEATLNVFPQRNVKVRFYNLVDAKGRQGINATHFSVQPTALESLIDTVNSIVGVQCDVWLHKTGLGLLRDLRTANDMGRAVDIDKFNIFGEPDRDPDAEYHVLFVWGISGTHTNGITKSNVTFLDASLPVEKRDTTLAHEFVHFLSGSGIVTTSDHDGQKSDLMFKTAPHGLMLRKDRLLKIIPH